jgi:hypothetical protein
MNFLTTIIQKLKPQVISRPLSRWRIELSKVLMNHKIDLSNEDHCGPCEQYALEKEKGKKITLHFIISSIIFALKKIYMAII